MNDCVIKSVCYETASRINDTQDDNFLMRLYTFFEYYHDFMAIFRQFWAILGMTPFLCES